MTHPHPAGLGLRASNRALRGPARPGNKLRRQKSDMLMRRYHVSYLDQRTSECVDQVKIAPAIPAFEHAFAAMARGTLLAGPQGPVAIEDLRPGMWLETAGKGACQVQWIGMMTFVPHLPHQGVSIDALLRITADSFGIGRPMPDLLLGPGARLRLARPGAEGPARLPIAVQADGESVVRVVPPAPVALYHVGFAEPRILCANGLEIESFQPAGDLHEGLDVEMMALYRGLFPHHENWGEPAASAAPRRALARDDGGWLETV